MAQRMAKHSSVLLYLFSLFESFRLKYSTCCSSSLTTWALSDASVCNTKGRLKLGDCKGGPPHRAAFTLVRVCWHTNPGTVSPSFWSQDLGRLQSRIVLWKSLDNSSTRLIAHFLGFAVSPATLSDLKTARRCSRCRYQSLLQIMMSSRQAVTCVEFGQRIQSMRSWKVAGARTPEWKGNKLV